MVLLREGGMTQPAIAAAMGVSLSTVNRAHMAYDDGGISRHSSRGRTADASART
jgi:transposase